MKQQNKMKKLLFIVHCLLLIVLWPLYSFSQTVTQSIVFLSLKINTPVEFIELTGKSDQFMHNTLQEIGLPLISRNEVSKHLDYNLWPPTLAAVSAIVPVNTHYVAVGSLSRLGDQLSIDIVLYDLSAKSEPAYFYQETDSMAGLQGLITKIINDIMVYTGYYSLIAEIKITGNERIDSGAIMRVITSQPQDRFDLSRLRHDLGNIFKLGFFDDVKIKITETEKGKEVTFHVKERAIISQILIDGENKLKEDDIREVITVTPNTIINTQRIRSSINSIYRLYKDKGFHNTVVTSKLITTQAGRVNISFMVDEGVKVYVREINFNGNTAFTDRQLMRLIETSEKGFFSWITDSGRLKRDMLEHDVARLWTFYQDNGYIEVKIGEPQVVQEGKRLYITFNISEGTRFKVGTIDLSGELIEEKSELLALLKLGEEEYFSRTILREDILRLTDRYAEKGYIFAEVRPISKQNIERQEMNITIDISKGIMIYVNRIVITGNTRTRDKVIRREMQIKEGEVFDATGLRQSTARLRRLDFFEDINIAPEPTPQENLMDIVVNVTEKPTGTFSVGAGYSSVDNFMFMGEVSQNNFRGKGQRLALQANLSATSTRYNFSFTEPHLSDSELSFGFDLYNWEREFEDYTKESRGFAVRFGYPIWEKWRASLGYGYDKTDLSDISPGASRIILESQAIEVTSSVRVSFVRDTRDRFHGTSKGSRHNLSIKYAGGLLGGDSAFTKLEGSTLWWFPLSWAWDTTFHLKGAAGYVIENENNRLPVYEKFYLGGLRTVRGFDHAHISPRDPATGERIGGTKMWYMNSEWIFPLVKEAGLTGVIFFDAGNVYRDTDNWDINDLKKSVGLGFRWMSPMGPLRLEWGYNLDPELDEEQGVWDFSIGGAF